MNQEPESGEVAPLPKRRVWPWVVGGAAVVVVVALAITIPLSIAAVERAAEEEARVAAEKAAADAERERLLTFGNAVAACDASNPNVFIRDGGESLDISRVTKFDGPTYGNLVCILDELGAPSAVEIAIGQTRALDGRQTDSWDEFDASWSFHPDDGASVLIEHSRD